MKRKGHTFGDIVKEGFSVLKQRIVLKLFSLWCLFFCSCPICFAADLGAVDYYNLANAAYGKGDFNSALVEFVKAAELGDNRADYQLGVMHLYGRGVPENPSRAVEYFTKSAQAGNDGAAFVLGRLYMEGSGVPVDIEKAVNIYREKAEAGNTFFQYVLGKLYLDGTFVPANKEIALKWLERSADNGSPFALYELGTVYESTDAPKAYMYYALAADMGLASASFKMKRFNDVNTPAVSSDSEEQDTPSGDIWMFRLAGENNVKALYELAEVYNHLKSGMGYDWHRKSADGNKLVVLNVFNKETMSLGLEKTFEHFIIPFMFFVVIAMIAYSILTHRRNEKAHKVRLKQRTEKSAQALSEITTEPVILLKEDELSAKQDKPRAKSKSGVKPKHKAKPKPKAKPKAKTGTGTARKGVAKSVKKPNKGDKQ